MKKEKIVFTGGGTGGHSVPIVAILRELRRIPYKKFIFYYLGPKDPFTKRLLEGEGVKIFFVLSGKIRRYLDFLSPVQNIIDLFKTILGILQSFLLLIFIRPRKIFSKGGFGSFPVVIAGWILGIPIFIHESDAVAGMANRILSRFARKVFISFEEAGKFFPKQKVWLVGHPIRREFFGATREEGIDFFNISSSSPIIFVLGGSQGAQRINEKIFEIINEILESFELIHQAGERNYNECKEMGEMLIKKELKDKYHLFGFLDEKELGLAYAVADLVISRAGAGAIFEIAGMGKPSILIPLPESAQSHQLRNAYAYFRSGACIVLEEENFTPGFFVKTIKNLFSRPEILKEMRKRALGFAKPDAAMKIVENLI